MTRSTCSRLCRSGAAALSRSRADDAGMKCPRLPLPQRRCGTGASRVDLVIGPTPTGRHDRARRAPVDHASVAGRGCRRRRCLARIKRVNLAIRISGDCAREPISVRSSGSKRDTADTLMGDGRLVLMHRHRRRGTVHRHHHRDGRIMARRRASPEARRRRAAATGSAGRA